MEPAAKSPSFLRVRPSECVLSALSSVCYSWENERQQPTEGCPISRPSTGLSSGHLVLKPNQFIVSSRSARLAGGTLHQVDSVLEI